MLHPLEPPPSSLRDWLNLAAVIALCIIGCHVGGLLAWLAGLGLWR